MKKYYFLFGEGSKINQIICAVLINLPVFAYGTCIGWMSPMTLVLQSDKSPRGSPLTDNEISWMASTAYLVCVPMDYAMAYIGDRIGRKKTVIFMSATCAALWILKLSTLETWALISARALVGISMAGCYVTGPVYTKEISEDSMRGTLGTLIILFQTIGNLFSYVIGDLLSFYTTLWICLAIPIIHMILFTMMPESPAYLVKTGKLEEAARVLAWLRCRSGDDILVQRELDLVKKEQKNDEASSDFKIKAIFQDKILFRAFRIALTVVFAREVCGSNVVLNFAGNIFSMSSKGTGLVLTPNQQAMMLGAVQVAGSTLGSSVVEKAGRKPLMVITSLVSGVSMCGLASWFLARTHQLSGADWLPITTLCVCIFCDAAGLQPVSMVVTAEIFSFKYRGTVLAITMAAASFADFITLLFFKPLSNLVGVHAVFYFFGGVCLIDAIYVFYVMPETKMRSLEEIYGDLKTKKEKEEDIMLGLKALENGESLK